jgi:hypothetical protein
MQHYNISNRTLTFTGGFGFTGFIRGSHGSEDVDLLGFNAMRVCR